MQVLIVEGNPDLGWVWRRHLERCGCDVVLAHNQEEAIEALRTTPVNVIVLDLVLEDSSAFAIADFASYRRPSAKVILTFAVLIIRCQIVSRCTRTVIGAFCVDTHRHTIPRITHTQTLSTFIYI